MFEHRESVLSTIGVMEALGCTTGQAFLHDTGCLLLQSPHGYRVLTGPPRPEAFEQDVGSGDCWRTCRPKISAARLFPGASACDDSRRSEADTKSCLRDYFLQWPQEWLSMLVRFKTHHSLHLLQFWGFGGADVCWEYPLLGFLVSLRSPGEMLNMVRSSPMDMLAKVGLRSVNPTASLKILARLAPEDTDLRAARYAQEAFASPRSLRRLCGLRRINRDCLELTTTSLGLEQYVSDQFLNEVAEGLTIGYRAPIVLRRALHLARRSGKGHFPVITTEQQLHDVYLYQLERERLRKKYLGQLERERLRKKRVLDWKFNHPFRGARTKSLVLETITSAPAAMVEAHNQGVCIGDSFMLETLHDGDMAAYIMRAPERATVTITRTQEGRWQLDEIALANNQGEVHRRTREEVLAWLAMAQANPTAQDRERAI